MLVSQTKSRFKYEHLTSPKQSFLRNFSKLRSKRCHELVVAVLNPVLFHLVGEREVFWAENRDDAK